MVETMMCPICGTQVEYAIENSPKWYRDPSLPVYRIDCHNKCRRYWLEAIPDRHPYIDPNILAFLDLLDDEQRTFISESTQRVCDNDCWLIYDKSGLQNLANDWHYAKAAVMLYGLNNVSLQVSGAGFDAANRLFFVDTDAVQFTMRLHKVGSSVHKVRSEIYWLEALWKEARIKTLAPVPGCDGEMVQSISANSLPPRYGTMYNWIPGKTLNTLSAEEKTPELIRNLGIMVGRMHCMSETLELPQWFTRPRYDIDWLNPQVEEALGLDYMDYSAEELAKLTSLPARFLQLVAEHGEGRNVFGLVHQDLAPHNIVIAEGQPCPIDVVHLGFGYYLLDILSLSGHLAESEQTIFFEGYQEMRSFPTDYRQQFALFEDMGIL